LKEARRMVNPRKKWKFMRQSAPNTKRLGTRWKRPRGEHNKLLRRERGKGKLVSIGFGAPKELRYLHPSGLKEILISNIEGLKNVDPKTGAVRLSHSISKKKREEILKRAGELNIKVLNP